jgi:outer membrane protein assembly factor BamB
MTIIELGDPGSAAARSVPAPRRREPHIAVRLAAVALLCVAAIGGSARPAPTMIRPGWSIPFDRTSIVKVTPGTVFILSTGGGSQVTAYDLGNGAVRWSKRLPMSRGRMTAAESGALMVPVGPAGDTEATVALDRRTGAEMWRLPGDVVHATPETALLAGPDATMRQVRIADGAEIWSRPLGHAVSWTILGPEPRSVRIVIAAPDGRVQVLRLSDGALLSHGRLPTSVGVPVKEDAGVLYVNRMETNRAVAAAYDLDTLTMRWRFAQGASDDVPAMAARACGIVLCFHDGVSTVGLDLDSGAARWRAGGWIDPVPVAGENRLLADSFDHAWHALIDSVTGRIVAELGAGTPVWDSTGSVPTYYLRAVAPSGRRVAVSRINLRTGELQVRGMVGAVGFPGCTAVGVTLVCGTADGRLAVTAVG